MRDSITIVNLPYSACVSPELHQAAEALDERLGIDSKFAYRFDLAVRLKDAVDYSLMWTGDLNKERKELSTLLGQVIDHYQAQDVSLTPSYHKNPLAGVMTQYPVPAYFLMPSPPQYHREQMWINALLLCAVLLNNHNNLKGVARDLRVALSKEHQSYKRLAYLENKKDERELLSDINNKLNTTELDTAKFQFLGALKDLLEATREVTRSTEITLPAGGSMASEDELLSGESPVANHESTEWPASATQTEQNIAHTKNSVFELPPTLPTKTRRWVNRHATLSSNFKTRLTQQEKQAFISYFTSCLSGSDLASRVVAGISLLMYCSGQKFSRVLKLQFGANADITPTGRLRRKLELPENAYQPTETEGWLPLAQTHCFDLPPDLACWLVNVYQEGKSLHESLPFSLEDLEKVKKRLFKKVRKQTGFSRIRQGLIPAALPIELKLLTGTESMVFLIAGKEKHLAPPISYYLAHSPSALSTTYCLALQRLEYSSAGSVCPLSTEVGDTDEKPSAGCYYPTADALFSLQSNATEAIKSAKASGDIIELHNAYTFYTLMLLFITTGHRAVLDPFASRFHFSSSGQFVVLSDKVVTPGWEWRVASLCETAVKQIEFYDKYLSVLPSKLFDSGHQKLGIGLKNSLAHEDKIAYFFTLSHGATGGIQSITESWFKERLRALGSYPANIHRKILATELFRRDVSGELIKIQLGHNYSNHHSFGINSPLSILQFTQLLSPHLEALLHRYNWQATPSPIRETTQIPDGLSNHRLPIRALGPEMRESTRKAQKRDTFNTLQNAVQALFGVRHFNTLSTAQLKSLSKSLKKRSGSDVVSLQCESRLARYIRARKKRNGTGKSNSGGFYTTEKCPIAERIAKDYEIGINTKAGFARYLTHSEQSAKPDKPRRIAEVVFSAALNGGLAVPEHLKALAAKLSSPPINCVTDTHINFALSNGAQYRWQIDSVTRMLLSGYSRLNGREKFSEKKIESALCSLLNTMNIDTSSPYSELSYLSTSILRVAAAGSLFSHATGELQTTPLPALTLKRIGKGEALPDADPHYVREDNSRLLFPRTLSLLPSNKTKTTSQFKKLFIKHKKAVSLLPFGENKNVDTKRKTHLAELVRNSLQASSWDTVSCLCGAFLLHIVEYGTKKTETPAYSTVCDYTESLINAFIKLSTPQNLLAEDEEFWQNTYIEALRTSKRKDLTKLINVFSQFHSLLVQYFDVVQIDFSPIYAELGIRKYASLVDANYVTESEYSALLKHIYLEPSLSTIERDITMMVALLGYRFGLRFNEAFGLTYSDVVILSDRLYVNMRNNIYRNGKTKNAPRFLSFGDINEIENSLLLRLEKVQYLAKREDHLASIAHTTLGAGRERLAPQIIRSTIHYFLKNLTGDYQLHFHHFRHTKATNAVQHFFHTETAKWVTSGSEQINGHFYGLFGIARSMGHALPETTFTHYCHCFDSLLHMSLEAVALTLSDKAAAYCKQVAYGSVRRQRLRQKKALVTSKGTRERNTRSFTKVPPELTIQLVGQSNKVNTLSLQDIDSILRIGSFTSQDPSQPLYTGHAVETAIYELAADLENETGFTRYKLGEANSGGGLFPVEECRRLNKALPDIDTGDFYHTDMLQCLSLWGKSYSPRYEGNAISTLRQFEQLISLFERIVGECKTYVYFPDNKTLSSWAGHIPAGHHLEVRETIVETEKLKAHRKTKIVIKIKMLEKRRLCHRVLFLVFLHQQSQNRRFLTH
ncbi:hypothetical protein [Alteromonas sp. CYL-A6]|uniref:hypothetical protein n=1 Tax=Alteromonas nitratireducens TaxID=3390813 RepID=UPI0034BD8E71